MIFFWFVHIFGLFRVLFRLSTAICIFIFRFFFEFRHVMFFFLAVSIEFTIFTVFIFSLFEVTIVD